MESMSCPVSLGMGSSDHGLYSFAPLHDYDKIRGNEYNISTLGLPGRVESAACGWDQVGFVHHAEEFEC